MFAQLGLPNHFNENPCFSVFANHFNEDSLQNPSQPMASISQYRNIIDIYIYIQYIQCFPSFLIPSNH